MEEEFCHKCGFLIQEIGNKKCKACNLYDVEMNNQKKVCFVCSCEYCLAVSFRQPDDPKDAVDWNINKAVDWDGSLLNSACQEDCIVENTRNNKSSDWFPSQKECAVSEEIRETWKREQESLKQKMSLKDSHEIKKLRLAIEKKNYGNKTWYIGGMDISFIKGDDINACAALVVVTFPDLEVVYEDFQMIQLTEPYIPGFLAFREASFLVDLHQKLLKTEPQFKPTVIFLDGNGLLHPREFGLACHVGVLINTPCVGVAKHLIHIDGLVNDDEFKAKKLLLKKGGDTIPLKNNNQQILGMALRCLDSTPNPVYISCGHLTTIETAVILVRACCKYRIPEPVRKADLNSREYLRREGYSASN